MHSYPQWCTQRYLYPHGPLKAYRVTHCRPCHVIPVLFSPSSLLQRWNQRLVTVEDSKLLIAKDALVSCVFRFNPLHAQHSSLWLLSAITVIRMETQRRFDWRVIMLLIISLAEWCMKQSILFNASVLYVTHSLLKTRSIFYKCGL